MSPPYRKVLSIKEARSKNAKESAVLILMYKKNNEAYIVLTERAIYKGKHSGQISFPGGKKEDIDFNLEMTALREAEEEIGIDINKITVLSALSYLYIPVSNFLVFPFVAIYKNIPKFKKDDTEVAKILEIKILDLLNSKNITEKEIRIDYKNLTFKTPAYKVNGVEVWGATAMILSEFLEVVKNSL